MPERLPEREGKPLTNAQLRKIMKERPDDRSVALFVAEIVRHRRELRDERVRCADIAGQVAPEAGAKIREYAQEVELEGY